MKQRGNTLVICLLVLSLISLVSVSLYQLSLQQFKASRTYLQQTQRQQLAQVCLNQALKKWQQLVVHEHKKPLWQENSAWWRQHGQRCQKKSWQYATLLLQQGETQYIKVASFTPPKLLLTAVIKIEPNKKTIPLNRSESS